ncbi:MAG TPA: hypothetical protein VLN48_15585, partial [Bryobacteraceae bacterium]|nr:hypothetical protein [Bryobacteraceae bacterium]
REAADDGVKHFREYPNDLKSAGFGKIFRKDLGFGSFAMILTTQSAGSNGTGAPPGGSVK